MAYDNHIIIPEFVSNIPEIGENFEEAIENLIMETNRTTKKLKPLTRPNENPHNTKEEKETISTTKNVKGAHVCYSMFVVVLVVHLD